MAGRGDTLTGNCQGEALNGDTAIEILFPFAFPLFLMTNYIKPPFKYKGREAKNKKEWAEKHPEERRVSRKKYYDSHKEKIRAAHKKYRVANFDRYREYTTKSRYGISNDDYNKMYEDQKGLCFICGKPGPIKSKKVKIALCIDHNHKTNKVRKLLCYSCNTILGLVDDNAEALTKLINYIKDHE